MDLLRFNCSDRSFCFQLSVELFRTVPRFSSTATQLFVPSQDFLVLSQDLYVLSQDSSVLSQDFSTKCWDSGNSSLSLSGLLNHCTWYHYLSSSKKIPKKPNLTGHKLQLPTPCFYLPFNILKQVETQLVWRVL